MYLRFVSFCAFIAFSVHAQDLSGILAGASRQTESGKVTGLRFQCVPSDCRVRPLETMVVQVLVDGDVTIKGGDPKKGRLRRAPGTTKLTDKEGGWVSKPFKFQGTDSGGFADDGGGTLRGILQKVTGDYLVQDAVLYTAPEKTGTYTLENETEGVKAQLKVTVDDNATSTKKNEEVTFPAENKAGEPYRELVERYAPMFAQETWFQPKSDFITRFDYDNDFLGDNNWENLDKGTSQAYIHYAVMETATHWFLIYNAFHPRDYSDKCVAGSCHENDNEGLILTVQKDGTQFGKLLTMETLAHNNIYSYTNDRSIRNGIHDIDAKIDLFDGSHPVVFVESGGHGIYGASTKNLSRYNMDKDEFSGGTGVTYIYKGVAERPKHASDRKVGYELLPILTHWWARIAGDQNPRMFDEVGLYEPFGGRPGIKIARLGHTFYGRKEASNKAKPFWGWHDIKTLKERALAPGQWGLDPAYGVSRNLQFPREMAFSLDYVYNPYLGIGGENAPAPTQSQIVITAGTPTITSPLPAPAAITGSDAREGYVEVTATVDASVIFNISQDQVTAEVLAGQPVRDQKNVFSAPMPSGAGIVWTVEKKSGRGEVRIVEQPTDANGQTLKVRVDDTKGGADKHVFRVKWKR